MLRSTLNFSKLSRNILLEDLTCKSHIRCCSSTTPGKSTQQLHTARNIPAHKLKMPIPTGIHFGQPTHNTHPHLLKSDEIVPEVTLEELQERRLRLVEKVLRYSMSLNSKIKNNIVIIPSAVKKFMSDKIPYVFRQNSDFLYFTGCLEPDSVLVIIVNESQEMNSILFMRPKDKHAELWDGARTGVEYTPDLFGVDTAYPIKDFEKFIANYIQCHPNGNYGFWYDNKTAVQSELSLTIDKLLQDKKPTIFESPLIFFHNLRVIKSPAELNLMRTTCDIGSRSLNKTIYESNPGDSEHHLFARVDYHSRMNNANFLAYPPVVAGGKNATTIHYVNNSQIIQNGEMVLMDAGCEYGGYSSDITRTWPINGNFTDPQRVLYEIVLAVQKELINTLQKPGGKTLDQLFDTMCVLLGRYLKEAGLINKQLSSEDTVKMAYRFCPHHVSHYLGMDVHDTPLISRSISLIPGMVCTVEPGIYIAADRMDVPQEFRGMGIRIEDDVAIQDGSVEVLTDKCIKELDELRDLRNS